MKHAAVEPLLWLAVAGVLSGATAQAAPASAYPTKPVRIVVPFTPGSSTDIVARLIAPRLAEHWGRTVVIDNRTGAGGIVAAELVAAANPDGHTLMVVGSGFAGSAALNSKLPYDPVADFSGVGQILTSPLVLVVPPALGVKSVGDLIALARQGTQQLSYSSAGIGSGTHYAAELFNLDTGIKALHVPHRGSPQALMDTVSGRVQFSMSPLLSGTPLIRNGRLLALGVTTRERVPAFPDVPTIAEAGLPGFEYQGWGGLLAPGKTPRGTVHLISKDLARVVELPEITKEIAELGAAAKSSSPEAFDALIRGEIASRRKVWKVAGVRME